MTHTVGTALTAGLEARGVRIVFGIPGVHTVELYRGLADSSIRHVTPRHEQGAAFAADGYARVSGRPGVCFLITGPGLANAASGMGQALADCIPMLVITGVNPVESFGKGRGLLHELPNQAAFARTVAKASFRIATAEDVEPVLTDAWQVMLTGAPGPVHIEVPTDVMGKPAAHMAILPAQPRPAIPRAREINQVAESISRAERPLILAGGGAAHSGPSLARLATLMDAPIVTTVNARGIAADSPLRVPASPSLIAVRTLMAKSDLVLAIGTEMGRTDYDMYDLGKPVEIETLVRVDTDGSKLGEDDDTHFHVKADSEMFSVALADRLQSSIDRAGAKRASKARKSAKQELSSTYGDHVRLLHSIWKRLPNARLIGDSTQLTYAGNLYCDAPQPGSWFNSATGFGTLGLAAPSCVGASLADPDSPVICLIGDGGLQFTLGELGMAADTGANVTFIVWNNAGFREIETFMVERGIEPVGCDPSAPDFTRIAKAYGIAAKRVNTRKKLLKQLGKDMRGPRLIEVSVNDDFYT